MIHASAPATLMLMGEHAVLHGKRALVAAATPRLHAYLRPRTDRSLNIQSSLGDYQGHLDQLEIKKPFQFVLSIIKQIHCQQGFDLEIRSDFSSTVGLGSSAAVMVATASAILALYPHEKSLFEICYASLQEVQGCGSGADLMAAILGGIVLYRRDPFLAEKIWPNPYLPQLPITLIYSGYKTPTSEVIEIVEMFRKKEPARYAALFQKIDASVLQGQSALLDGDLPLFAKAIKANQKSMQQLGVSDSNLDQIVAYLQNQPAILAAKITGSGLGDCVFAVGKAQCETDFPWQKLDVQLSGQGVQIHD